MTQWAEIRLHGPTNPREVEFLENNMHDQRGFWRRSPEGTHWQLRVPTTLRQRVIWDYHDVPLAGHPGAEETTRAIQERFFWPGMSRQIRRYVAGCHLCICTKPLHGRTIDGQRPRSARTAWETVAVDLMGPYPLTNQGNRFILIVTDMFTRWVESFPLRNSHAPTLIRTLEKEVFSRFGYPHYLLSDNGKQFTSTAWAEASQKWECELWTTPEYHPRANPTERRNQEIKKGLRLRLTAGNQRVWDEQLPGLLFGLRRRRNAATGCTPAHLLMGREILRPGEWALRPANDAQAAHVPFEERENQARENQKQYQLRYTGAPAAPAFEIGDWVYALNHRLSNKAEGYNADLAPKPTGPYRVVGAASTDVFWVQKHDRAHKIHRNQLVLVPPRQVTPAVTRPDRDETLSGSCQRDGDADSIAEVHGTDLLVEDEARHRGTAVRANQGLIDVGIVHTAEKARPTDCRPAADVASEGAAVQARPYITSHLQTHEVTTSAVGAKNIRPIPTMDPLPPATQGPPDLPAVVEFPEPQDDIDEEFRGARGRYNLRERQPVVYRDARPKATRKRSA